MNRVVLAALAVLLLAAAGVFWFTGREAVATGAPSVLAMANRPTAYRL